MIARFNMLSRCLLAIMTLVLLFAGVNARAQTPANNAQLISMAIPHFEAGQSDVVTVTMKNTGTTTWPANGNYKLRTSPPWESGKWSLLHIAPASDVAPGQQYAFSVPLTAPGNGYFNMQAQMELTGVALFGDVGNGGLIVGPPPDPAPASQNGAQVIGISAPASLPPGQSATVSVTMQNTGSTTWSSDVGYALGSQNPAGNTTWGIQAVGFNADVIPGQQTTFVFTVTAPAAGSYSMQWQMKQGTQSFGGIASAPVTVTASEPPPPTSGVETITYIHTDGLGSPVARTDGAGALVSRTSYEPYGRTATGATPTIGFTGHVNDADTGLVYMQQRYYDPVAGRFLSVDPVTTDANTGGSFNRYVYGNNSPYKYIDPDGRFVFLIPLIPYVATATVAVLGHYALPGRQGREASIRALSNAVLNIGENAPGTVGSDKGCIYLCDGVSPGQRTPSGNPYVGSADDKDKRAKGARDGRERDGAKVIGEYEKGDKEGRANAEQTGINEQGGKGQLDNKRDEVSEKKWGNRGIKPPEDKTNE